MTFKVWNFSLPSYTDMFLFIQLQYTYSQNNQYDIGKIYVWPLHVSIYEQNIIQYVLHRHFASHYS
jgi:hypothetical protein